MHNPETLGLFNQTSIDYPDNILIHQIFEQQVEITPNRIAVTTGQVSISYHDLNRRANQLAHTLCAKGVRPNQVVTILLERSIDTIVAILAVLKAGAAYLTLDTDYPADRIRTMIEEAESLVILNAAVFSNNAWFSDNTNNLSAKSTVNDLAYLIYTSGSTGKPKGIEMPVAALVKYIDWYRSNKSRAYKVLQLSSIGFGVSFSEIFSAISFGGTLVIAGDDIKSDFRKLADFIETHQVTQLHFTVTVFQQWLNYARHSPLAFCTDILTVGERLNITRALKEFFHKRPHIHYRNLYATSETQIVTAYSFPKAISDWPHYTPVGKPIDNTEVYILDKTLTPVASDTEGEIYVGGAGLANGYFKRPELTQARFIDNPFVPGGKMYRTGDLACWHQDGNIEHLGRGDDQVKIRGYRVEVGEIENALLQHPTIDNALIVVDPSTDDTTLCAYYVSAREISTMDLTRFLRQTLPHFMLPDFFIALEQFPLNTNGKVDRQRLPDPRTTATMTTRYQPAQSDTEKDLVQVWARLLGIIPNSIGIEHDFFALGGNSLKVLQLLQHIDSHYQQHRVIADVFSHSTIAQLARLIDTQQKNTQGPDSPPAWINRYMDLKNETDLGCLSLPETALHKESVTTPEHILLTGVTGFVGIFLLQALLIQTDADIYCLVRADNTEQGRGRITNSALAYHLDLSVWQHRIIPVCGDLSLARMGLSSESYRHLSTTINTVFHNGAQVNFSAPYALTKTSNVEGTKALLQFCAQAVVKPCHYISTLSIFESPLKIATMSALDTHGREAEQYQENSDIAGLRLSPHHGYVSSKWVAEKLVLQAKAQGIPCSCLRLGRITGSAKTGAANTDDFFHRLWLGCLLLNAYPSELEAIPVELSPVDFVAESIVKLSLANPGHIYHLQNPGQMPFAKLLQQSCQSSGNQLKKLPFEQWLSAAKAYNTEAQYPFQSILPLLDQMHYLLDTHERSEQAVSIGRFGETPVCLDNSFSNDALIQHGLHWPATEALLKQYLDLFHQELLS